MVASQLETGNTPNNVKKLAPGWMIAYLFVVSFVGLFSIVPLRRVWHSLKFLLLLPLLPASLVNITHLIVYILQMMIMKLKLTYPSGTATAYLINSFHTPKEAKLAK